MQDPRQEQLAQWIGQQLNISPPQLKSVSGDASFRRYFRFSHQDTSLIAVDAPPEHENNEAFCQLGKILAQCKVLVPHFYHVDLRQGFLLVSDLGDRLLLPELNQHNVNDYYQQAIDIIIQIQSMPLEQLTNLPRYDQDKLAFELNLFNQWFVERHLQLSLSEQEQRIIIEVFNRLIESALSQTPTLVHRDFHSRNLMLCDNRMAVIDFQDAVVGPASYDLVSLLKDCYVEWPGSQVARWVADYHQKARKAGIIDNDEATFFRQFEWMGMQRHIKVLGIFCRLNYRDQKPAYLKDLPLTFDYLKNAAARYPEFSDFHALLIDKLAPAMNPPSGVSIP